MSKQKRIVLGVTGSIAAYKSADLVRALIEKGLKISVVMTKEAEHFITPLTLSTLAGEEVYTEMFASQIGWSMAHIYLAQEADVLLIAPATANIIGKLANGLADDILCCTALGTKAKKIIAPAMNAEMFSNPVVQENCKKLKKLGYSFIGPIKGSLACGVTGDGHLAKEESIVKEVLRALK